MTRAGRRPGQSQTREHILAAARELFAARGYTGATVRAIAAEAGVNPAMLRHFFGTKQGVFVAAMELPFNPAVLVPEVLNGPPEQAGERLVRLILRLWGDPESRAPFLTLLRSATTNEQASRMMREFMVDSVLDAVAEARGISETRVAALLAQLMGLALLRYVVEVPALAEASDEELVELIAPAVQGYLDG